MRKKVKLIELIPHQQEVSLSFFSFPKVSNICKHRSYWFRKIKVKGHLCKKLNRLVFRFFARIFADKENSFGQL